MGPPGHLPADQHYIPVRRFFSGAYSQPASVTAATPLRNPNRIHFQTGDDKHFQILL
jgi:hypothetical protein